MLSSTNQTSFSAIQSQMRPKLSRELAASFADIALAHVTREYPGKMDHILTGPADIASPRALHPAFYGSFDWHSCVHGFWLLAKILRLFPDLPQAVETTRMRYLFIGHRSGRINKNISVEADHYRSCISSRGNRWRVSPQRKPFVIT